MSLNKLFAWLAPTLLLSALCKAPADTIETKQDERLRGRVVRESPQEVVFRTPYGDLAIPRASIKQHTRATYIVTLKDGTRLEGQVVGEEAKSIAVQVGAERRQVPLADVESIVEKPPTPAPKPPDPQRLLGLHRRSLEQFDKKDYAGAKATCEEILKAAPDDPTALYNAACACARLGEKPRALDYLKKAVEAGFVDFQHIEQDDDLGSLRAEAAYKELFAKREAYVKQASQRTVERIAKQLAERGIDAKRYKTIFDPARNFVYVHAKDDAEIAELRRGLEAYAEIQWRTLFQNKPQQPLYIVLLTAADSPKLFRGGVGGFYNPGTATLFCSDMPVNKLLRADVVTHEFTHALHFADMRARRQEHPLWLIEGLATLFETSDRNGSITPRHNHRLEVAQQAARQGRLLQWTALMNLNPQQFMTQAQLAYAQARYMLFYMHEKGLLKRFYDDYTAGENYARDRAAADSVQAVFGKPIEEVERDWRQWLLKQQAPPIPFLGVGTKEDGGRLIVADVQADSPAAKAGIRPGDAITAIAGRAVDTQSELMETIGSRRVDEEVEIEIVRDGKPQKVKAKLARRGGLLPPGPEAPPYLGITVEQKNGALLIKEVAQGSPAHKAGLRPGAAIIEFAGKPPGTVRDFLAALRKMKPGQKVAIKAKQGDETRTLTVDLAPQP